MRHWLTGVALPALVACGDPGERSPAPGPRFGGKAAVPDSAAVLVADSVWERPGKDFAGTRYSSLREITTANARNLRQAWTFETGVLRGQEAAPIVAGGTMYVITPFPNVVYAFDLTRSGPAVKWTFRPEPNPQSQGVACCDVVNRGVVFDGGRIFFNTLDAWTFALDAETGREIWRTRVGDINLGESMTMAPLVVKGIVLVGNSGGEFGVRGAITGLDASTGRVVWKAYHTGPDSDVLIGPNFAPFYESHRGRDLGVSTWPPDKWRIGGGTVWGWITYDPELDLIYYGTGNPGPWNPEQRPGDNKWTSAIFARRPVTGEAIWAYQLNPHDLHDYDGINENVLVDIEWKGTSRKVLLHPERNGYMYVIDRATGEVLSAQPFVRITTSSHVDLATGELHGTEAKYPVLGRVVRDICPASPGAKDWQPSAWSPRTRLLYIPHNNLCQDSQSVEANYIAGTPFLGMNVKMYAGPGGNRGFFTAWDPVRERIAWQIREDLPVWSGALVTEGDVVFYGTMDGWFKAVDARTGERLWQQKLSSGIIGQPTTFLGPDGRQYVAIMSGVGGWSGAVVAAGLDTRDSSAALGFANAMKDLPARTTTGGTLYVFSL